MLKPVTIRFRGERSTFARPASKFYTLISCTFHLCAKSVIYCFLRPMAFLRMRRVFFCMLKCRFGPKILPKLQERISIST
jgi:hypothetical protein